MDSGNEETSSNAGTSGGNPPNVPQAKNVSKPDNGDLRVRYVLYSHISYGEAEDFLSFTNWKKQSEAHAAPGAQAGPVTPVPGYRTVRELRPFCRELRRLLTDEEMPGMLILFYAKGYAACLEDIAEEQHPTRAAAVKKHPDLGCADEVQRSLQSLFDSSDLGLRVRVITALDLYDIFSRIETDYAKNLIQWFIGLQEETMRYDAPKIIEAIIRVRMIGSGAPVFRIDQDVLFRRPSADDRGNAKKASLALRKSIRTCVRAFHERVEDPRMAAFLFSGSYDSSLLGEPGKCRDFYAWSRAFATRCFPALCIVREMLGDALEAQREANDRAKEAKKALQTGARDAEEKAKQAREAEQTAGDRWKAYVTHPRAVDAKVMCDFFGIEKTRRGGNIVADPVNQDAIGWLGANPLVSVISGALLCINDSAILDLPPFSNFNLNVSWIDDHLKYCLHRELRHFTTVSITTGPKLVQDARIDRVEVVKGREPPQNLAEYIMGNYLPTVLYGCVVDAWITPGPNEGRPPRADEKLPCGLNDYNCRDDRIMKWRPQMLDPARQKEWDAIPQSGLSRGLLPHKLQIVLGRGTPMSPLERLRFRRDLQETALKRITRVRDAWSELASPGGRLTFAHVWALGEGLVDVVVPGMTRKGKGLVRTGVEAGIDLKMGDLTESVRDGLAVLIEDAVTYIDMTLNWSKIVQFIRWIEPGTLKTDLFWKP